MSHLCVSDVPHSGNLQGITSVIVIPAECVKAKITHGSQISTGLKMEKLENLVSEPDIGSGHSPSLPKSSIKISFHLPQRLLACHSDPSNRKVLVLWEDHRKAQDFIPVALDSHQFAYRENWSIQNAASITLPTWKCYCTIFVDFSSGLLFTATGRSIT